LEDGIIKIKFVKPAENDSDIFTRNVSQELHEAHGEVLEEWHEEFGI
jgi:hypothetical protein